MSNAENKYLDTKVAYFDWNDVDFFSRKLAIAVKSSEFAPEIIVGVQRGGCIPAVFLSHLLKVKDFFTIGMRTTLTEGLQAPRQTPVITNDASMCHTAGKRALLVDDVTNTGATLMIAKKCILGFGCKEVKTAVLVWDTTNIKSCIADYCGTAVDSWVVFPWET